jgi:hypothetical protein
MPRPQRPERVTPPLREYSFAECPAAKLAACCQYEYLRSSELILDAVARSRAGETDPLALSVALLFRPDIFWAFKDTLWPRLPYLDADEERGRSPEPPPLQKRKRRNLARLVNPWTRYLNSDDARRIVAIYIPPGQSLPRLKKAFGDLLSSDYPELLAKEPVNPEWRTQKRGRGSLIEQFRVDLAGLSAWRLQNKYGYTVEAAIRLLGRSASEERAFYRYVRRADQKIKALEAELCHLAHKVTL